MAGIGIVSPITAKLDQHCSNPHFEQIPTARKLKSQVNPVPRGEFQQTPRQKL
jgi:hypothetical protein